MDTKIDTSLKIKALAALAHYYHVTGQRGLKAEMLINSVKLSEQVLSQKIKVGAKDSVNFGVACLNLGDAFLEDGQTNLAQNYFSMGKMYVNSYKKGVAFYYKAIVNVCLRENNETLATTYNDSLMNYEKTDRKTFGYICEESNIDLTLFYLKKKNIRLASHYYEVAKQNQLFPPDMINDGYLENLAAKILMLEHRNTEALVYLESIKNKPKNWLPERYTEYIKDLAECYASTGNASISNKYYQLYLPLKDSVSYEEARQHLVMAEAKYQNKRKQDKIEEQHTIIGYANKQKLWLLIALA
ncbi:MAG: hypothetical protein WDM90_03460 [Ferruginibacter sp.]